MSDLLKVTRDVEQPVGGWKFQVAETGVTLSAASALSLAKKVRQHMVANSVELPRDFQHWFEDAMCRQQGYGDPLCGEGEKSPPPGTEGLSMAQLDRFARTMWEWALRHGLKPVSQEEADRRAAICADCSLNVQLGGCKGCRGLLRRISETIGERQTSHHGKLHECGACGCTLHLKVWVPTEVLNKTEEGDPPSYAPGCWRLE